jgi:glycosyltransferase involved in cell wall biosynthesis
LGDDTAQQEVQEDGHQILFFGRIWEYKGLEYLIKAEPFITAQMPQAKIVIAGRGEEFDHYREMMVHPDQFIVHNEYISDEKRAELFRQASVVVLPYIEATQSGVIPVAYTFGKPVVTTAVGGLPDQVEDGQTGLLVPPRNEQALANAIICLMQDAELRHRLGAKGKQKLETEWSADAVAQETLPVYYRAAQGSRRTMKEPLQNKVYREGNR